MAESDIVFQGVFHGIYVYKSLMHDFYSGHLLNESALSILDENPIVFMTGSLESARELCATALPTARRGILRQLAHRVRSIE